MSDLDEQFGQTNLRKPWYKNSKTPPPIRLTKRISSKAPDAPNYRTIACFPWDKHSLTRLWNGRQNTEEQSRAWAIMVAKYWDAIAVGAEDHVAICFTHSKRQPIRIKLPKAEGLMPADKIHVAWGIAPNTLTQPLVIFSQGGLLYTYNLESDGISSYIRGHGGAITSIAVHPLTPHLFCTTSRDHSARIYNLTFSPVTKPNNPHWPPNPRTTSSRAGPAHGLHMNQSEGSGLGRCIVVLMGGRSGGHNAAVLGAAFHPRLPVIATCGMDRTIKIWAVRTDSTGERILREDKPLFGSARIHKARVMSVTWLQDDVLVSHSAPAIMRQDPNAFDRRETYLEPGHLVVWKWLSMNRFFPPHIEDRQNYLRGCASDYQESSSFKFVAVYSLQEVDNHHIAPSVSTFQTPTHDPLALITLPQSESFLITDISSLKPRNMPSFEEAFPHIFSGQNAIGDLETSTARLNIGEGAPDGHDHEMDPCSIKLPEFTPEFLIDQSQVISLPDLERRKLNCSAMTCGGRLIVGAGTGSTIWVWEVDKDTS